MDLGSQLRDVEPADTYKLSETCLDNVRRRGWVPTKEGSQVLAEYLENLTVRPRDGWAIFPVIEPATPAGSAGIPPQHGGTEVQTEGHEDLLKWTDKDVVCKSVQMMWFSKQDKVSAPEGPWLGQACVEDITMALPQQEKLKEDEEAEEHREDDKKTEDSEEEDEESKESGEETLKEDKALGELHPDITLKTEHPSQHFHRGPARWRKYTCQLIEGANPEGLQGLQWENLDVHNDPNKMNTVLVSCYVPTERSFMSQIINSVQRGKVRKLIDCANQLSATLGTESEEDQMARSDIKAIIQQTEDVFGLGNGLG